MATLPGDTDKSTMSPSAIKKQIADDIKGDMSLSDEDVFTDDGQIKYPGDDLPDPDPEVPVTPPPTFEEKEDYKPLPEGEEPKEDKPPKEEAKPDEAGLSDLERLKKENEFLKATLDKALGGEGLMVPPSATPQPTAQAPPTGGQIPGEQAPAQPPMPTPQTGVAQQVATLASQVDLGEFDHREATPEEYAARERVLVQRAVEAALLLTGPAVDQAYQKKVAAQALFDDHMEKHEWLRGYSKPFMFHVNEIHQANPGLHPTELLNQATAKMKDALGPLAGGVAVEDTPPAPPAGEAPKSGRSGGSKRKQKKPMSGQQKAIADTMKDWGQGRY